MDQAKQYFVSLTSMSLAGICTAPFDVVKTRLQMQQKQLNAPQRGFVAMLLHVWRTESWRALFKGVTPMLGRALTHGALRMSLYAPIKESISSLVPTLAVQPAVALGIKIAAGASSGAFAALVSNPLELLKVRAQTDTAHTSPIKTFKHIVASEGVGALWKGVSASMQRSALLTVGQLTAYDQIKSTLRDSFHLDPNTKFSQISSSVVAGFFTATITNPIDVIKTRLMNQKHASSQVNIGSSTLPFYRGTFHAFTTIVANEGWTALLKGWVPNFSRQGPQTVIMLFVAERMRTWLGMPPV
jgi:hypothetical protein